jgi:hypothetical protein
VCEKLNSTVKMLMRSVQNDKSAKEECREKLLFQANLYNSFAHMPPTKSFMTLNDTNSEFHCMFHIIQGLLQSYFLIVRSSAEAFYEADTRSKERKVNQNSHVKPLLRDSLALYCCLKEGDKLFFELAEESISG